MPACRSGADRALRLVTPKISELYWSCCCDPCPSGSVPHTGTPQSQHPAFNGVQQAVSDGLPATSFMDWVSQPQVANIANPAAVGAAVAHGNVSFAPAAPPAGATLAGATNNHAQQTSSAVSTAAPQGAQPVGNAGSQERPLRQNAFANTAAVPTAQAPMAADRRATQASAANAARFTAEVRGSAAERDAQAPGTAPLSRGHAATDLASAVSGAKGHTPCDPPPVRGMCHLLQSRARVQAPRFIPDGLQKRPEGARQTTPIRFHTCRRTKVADQIFKAAEAGRQGAAVPARFNAPADTRPAPGDAPPAQAAGERSVDTHGPARMPAASGRTPVAAAAAAAAPQPAKPSGFTFGATASPGKAPATPTSAPRRYHRRRNGARAPPSPETLAQLARTFAAAPDGSPPAFAFGKAAAAGGDAPTPSLGVAGGSPAGAQSPPALSKVSNVAPDANPARVLFASPSESAHQEAAHALGGGSARSQAPATAQKAQRDTKTAAFDTHPQPPRVSSAASGDPHANSSAQQPRNGAVPSAPSAFPAPAAEVAGAFGARGKPAAPFGSTVAASCALFGGPAGASRPAVAHNPFGSASKPAANLGSSVPAQPGVPFGSPGRRRARFGAAAQPAADATRAPQPAPGVTAQPAVDAARAPQAAPAAPQAPAARRASAVPSVLVADTMRSPETPFGTATMPSPGAAKTGATPATPRVFSATQVEPTIDTDMRTSDTVEAGSPFGEVAPDKQRMFAAVDVAECAPRAGLKPHLRRRVPPTTTKS